MIPWIEFPPGILPLIWGYLICTAIFLYVVLDGFDLGVGILFSMGKDKAERDAMMNSIAPVWDGNETWIVLGGAGLYAVFPLAYSILMTAFYMPLMIMLLALIFRGVAFEFRYRSRNNRHWWNRGFQWGSMIATFCQGVILGGFLQGIEVSGRSYAGGWFDWISPFSLFTGFSLIFAYGLLGSTWLIYKTEGEMQLRFYKIAGKLAILMLVAIAGVSLWTPLMSEAIAERWFGEGNFLKLLPLPITTGILSIWLLISIHQRRELTPFILTLTIFLLSFVGIGISQYPYIIPREYTIWQAAGPDSALGFLLVGAAVLLPTILAYTAWSYWVFRGKVKLGEGYH